MTAAISATPRNAPAKGIVYMLAASATLVDECVGWRRWLAVAVGVLGVLIAAQPSAAGIGAGARFSLAAALFHALAQAAGAAPGSPRDS